MSRESVFEGETESVDFGWVKALLLDMAAERCVDSLLSLVVDRMAAQSGVALARLWLVMPADICGACPMRAECADRARCLHLLASAGQPRAAEENWSSVEGSFRRVPLGARQIGHIAATEQPMRVVDLNRRASRVARPDWVRREGIRGFVGQPMICRGELLGVLGVFMRRNPDDDELSWLRMIADHAASAVANARAFEEIERLRRRTTLENEYLRGEIEESHAFGRIVGDSAALRAALEQVDLVAPTDTTVLIQGESGTGKELIARGIHERSGRAGRAMIKVNCASIPRDLFESEFFGHVRGAFTGAVRDRVGRFELADGGTLFLDEVGEIPLDMQGKLLRVLQEGTFERIGDDSTRRVDVRVVAATNRDLAGGVVAGEFRQDLYYRLSVFPIELAALRDRAEDIVPLAEHFLAQQCRRLGVRRLELTAPLAEQLSSYPWPGNIRELQNVIERAVITARVGPLRFSLPSAPPPTSKCEPAHSAVDRRVYTQAELKQLERDNLMTVLERANWKIAGRGGAAEFLGINPATLTSRMKAMGIRRPR